MVINNVGGQIYDGYKDQYCPRIVVVIAMHTSLILTEQCPLVNYLPHSSFYRPQQ